MIITLIILIIIVIILLVNIYIINNKINKYNNYIKTHNEKYELLEIIKNKYENENNNLYKSLDIIKNNFNDEITVNNILSKIINKIIGEENKKLLDNMKKNYNDEINYLHKLIKNNEQKYDECFKAHNEEYLKACNENKTLLKIINKIIGEEDYNLLEIMKNNYDNEIIKNNSLLETIKNYKDEINNLYKTIDDNEKRHRNNKIIMINNFEIMENKYKDKNCENIILLKFINKIIGEENHISKDIMENNNK